MPKVVRYGGLSVNDDVVRIRDLGPGLRPRAKPKAGPGADFEPEAGDLPAEGAPEGVMAEDEAGLDEEAAGFDEDAYGDAVEPAAETASAAPGADAQVVTSEIIQSAMAEAGRIMEQALRDAEEKKAQALAGVQAEAQQLRQQAAEEGRLEGFSAVADTVKGTANDIENAIARFEGERAGFEAEYEEQMKWLAMEIAGKVLAKKVSEDDAVMADMVGKAVQSVRSEPWIRIEVAQEMGRLIDTLTYMYDDVANISVSPVPLEPGTIHIETPSGVVDASLRTQLENLKEYFSAGSA